MMDDVPGLARLLSRSAALKLLRSEQAPHLLALAHRLFRVTGQAEVPESLVQEQLAAQLEREGAVDPDMAARRWISAWCDDDHRWMRRVWVREGNEPAVLLRPDVERVLRWVDELRPREFVGTESRFEQIVGLLRQLAERTTEDPEVRIAELAHQRDRLQAEIDEIRATGRMDVFTEVQVRERLQGVRDGVASLLGDFREVEERFREIGREVQERRLEGALSKGGIVGELLEADQELRQSPQGQSFGAFHGLLLAPQGQDELLRLVDLVVQLPEVRPGSDEDRLFRGLLDRFLAAAERVEGGVRSMAGQIRRVLDERRVGEDMRSRELLDRIRQMALGLREREAPEGTFHEVDGPASLGLALERPLWEPAVPVRFDNAVVDVAVPDVGERMDALFQRIPVDLSRLRAQLDGVVSQRGPCLLSQVLEAHPVELGMAELVGWLKAAAGRPGTVRETGRDEIEVRDRLLGTATRVRIPRWRMK